ncbi:BA14K family protein [Bradyrhizobium prioriisuperbiae]|uniref:BA14K family protein n=1 Tax=Bradyrhizobium prioriisuperbiae TaxID=2854389 RepID=UPI0028E4271B|nr:BA14K family protein [Bradyrhizobium prioritasuperba]
MHQHLQHWPNLVEAAEVVVAAGWRRWRFRRWGLWRRRWRWSSFRRGGSAGRGGGFGGGQIAGGGGGWRGGGGGGGFRGGGWRGGGWHGHHHHRHRGYWPGIGIGGAYASPYYYDDDYYDDDVAVDVAPSGGSVAYCKSRFKSYNPATGTYLGYDGRRHPCP